MITPRASGSAERNGHLSLPDVEGSMRLLAELGADAYAAALAEHRRVIRQACASEDGVEVDTQGDAFFFAFPTAPWRNPRVLCSGENFCPNFCPPEQI
jgi:class 3 adenylate cyclase